MEVRRFSNTSVVGESPATPPPAPFPVPVPVPVPQPHRAEKRRERTGVRAVLKRCRLSESNPPSASSSASPSMPQTLSFSSSGSSSSSSSGGDPESPPPPPPPEASPEPPPPAYGMISVAGRSREMEDAVSLQTELLPALHFFAVFDGHGGSHVATLCKERMHVYLAEELRLFLEGPVEGENLFHCRKISPEEWKTAMNKCFMKMDEIALNACACGMVGPPPCECELSGTTSEFVGSTAVAAVIRSNQILVANCGDSRAVLSRGGRAIPLSTDHKGHCVAALYDHWKSRWGSQVDPTTPDRPDELTRIEAAGGRVIYLNGYRVNGILAMSRALGDKYLKPVVIAEPEITITQRTAEDEFLILASDGLWDVLSNDTACDVARRCLYEGRLPTPGGVPPNAVAKEEEDDDEPTPHTRCHLAAALLTRLALGRKSSDNISVIVVDLGRGSR
ncbi:putative protein phosphatase 2C 75 [Acorus calamus]|uniref:protein-serine/threonine phosphatase n=1 Tax=Acorus calamus TaxID=4465 RepID=A0AAV9C4X2_ACOCL|nr:putative protein phosphatase 2C 75 [Acorus calamus]